ncbi:MAG: enoyl-CoA hydratase/isomerase family protein [Chloroflexi bacterium]|nr:enoyl-CoA hydratase/isomerase family protein [Chloroflexota bacterium]
MDGYRTIRYELAGGVATLTINRPDRFNGMTTRMLRETHHALTGAAADPAVKVLVMTGAGKAFCPGADLRAATSTDEPPDNVATDLAAFHVPVLLHDMPALTIAAVNGACAGAGMGWACGADIRVAARSAMFNTAFLNVAVAGDMGLPWSLPRLVGAAKARELSFFTEKFTADEAARIGLVARVWDDAVFSDEVAAMVARFAGASPVALRTLKAHYVAAERMDFGTYVDLESERHQYIVASEDTREAFRAFMEKRPPVFKRVS